MNYIGKWLQEMREKQNITKENLSDGICSISLLTKIERGERYADKLIMDALLSRLGLGINSYLLFLSKQEYYFIKIRTQIQILLRKQNYFEAEQTLNRYCETNNKIKSVYKQQILMFKAQILREKNFSSYIQMETILQALSITIKDITQSNWSIFNLKKEKRYSLFELDLFAKYAFLLNEVHETAKALILYSSILTYQESIFTLDVNFIKFYMETIYTTVKILYYYEEYSSAIKFCFRAFIQVSKYNIPSFFILKLIDLYKKCNNNCKEDLLVYNYLEEVNKYKNKKRLFKNIEKYYNVNIYPIHKVIRFRRNSLNISQEEIADGLCAISTISRIECGVSKPNHKLEEQLLLRLKLPMNYCGLPSSFHKNDIQLTRTMIQYYLLGKYHNAMLLLQILKHNLNSIRPENQYFFMCWENLISSWI